MKETSPKHPGQTPDAKPAPQKLMLEDDAGTNQEWEVSHTDDETGLVYLKHYYGDRADDTFVYKGVSAKRFNELQGIEDEAALAAAKRRVGEATARAADAMGKLKDKTGKPEKTKPVAKTHETARDQNGLPATFDEIRHLPGHSIEDFLETLPDVGHDEAFYAMVPGRNGFNKKDEAFLTDPAKIDAYDARLIKFTGQVIKDNPYRKQRRATTNQGNWQQHDSQAFVRSRVEDKSTDVPTTRLYLNPPIENTLDIYREIYEKAEAAGLRFRAKVLNFDLSRAADRHETRAEFAKWLSERPRYREDPLVFYGFPESTEELYTIVKEVYAGHSDQFAGRALGAVPYEVAPGFGVGEEPIELTGSESLSSVVFGSIIEIERSDDWKAGKTPAERKKLFAAAYRRKVKDEPINPDNLAFR